MNLRAQNRAVPPAGGWGSWEKGALFGRGYDLLSSARLGSAAAMLGYPADEPTTRLALPQCFT